MKTFILLLVLTFFSCGDSGQDYKVQVIFHNGESEIFTYHGERPYLESDGGLHYNGGLTEHGGIITTGVRNFKVLSVK